MVTSRTENWYGHRLAYASWATGFDFDCDRTRLYQRLYNTKDLRYCTYCKRYGHMTGRCRSRQVSMELGRQKKVTHQQQQHQQYQLEIDAIKREEAEHTTLLAQFGGGGKRRGSKHQRISPTQSRRIDFSRSSTTVDDGDDDDDDDAGNYNDDDEDEDETHATANTTVPPPTEIRRISVCNHSKTGLRGYHPYDTKVIPVNPRDDLPRQLLKTFSLGCS